MSSTDVAAAGRLRAIAGWNQCLEDWLGFLALEPAGCFVGQIDTRVVATATTIRYAHRFGWIGMILVDPDHRRQGIATALMDASIAFLETSGCPCQKLDATAAGAQVYERIGFRTEYPVERWAREPGQSALPSSSDVRPWRADDLEAAHQLDLPAFGADRRRLLDWYARRTDAGFVLPSSSGLHGFILGRPGSNAYQIGPAVADSAEVAEQLLSAALSRVQHQPLLVDLATPNEPAMELMARYGFHPTRHLQRMFRGGNPFPGDPNRVFCLSAFEFG